MCLSFALLSILFQHAHTQSLAHSFTKQDEERGHVPGKKEMTSQEMGVAAEELRKKRKDKDSHEQKAKELFRDMRRHYEKVLGG